MDISKQNELSAVDTTVSHQEIASSNREAIDAKSSVSSEQNKKTSEQQFKNNLSHLYDQDFQKVLEITDNFTKPSNILLGITKFQFRAIARRFHKFPRYKIDVSKQNEASGVDRKLMDQEVASSNRRGMDAEHEKPNVSTEHNNKTSKQQFKNPCLLSDQDFNEVLKMLDHLEKAYDMILSLIQVPQIIAVFDEIQANSRKNREYPPNKMDVSKENELCVDTTVSDQEASNRGTEENNKTSEQKFKIKNIFPLTTDKEVHKALKIIDTLKKAIDIITKIIIDGTSINSDCSDL